MFAALNNSAASPVNQEYTDTSVFTNPGVYQSTTGYQSTVNQSNVNTGFQPHMPTGK